MEKIAILVDTASDIDLDLASNEGIYVLPLYVNLNGDYLKDREELNPNDFYDWIKVNKTLPRTSTASPGDVEDIYKRIKDDGYEEVLVITIGSKFSSTFNLFNMVKFDGLNIHVFDTGTLTLAEGIFAIYAKDLINQGYGLNEIIEKLESKKSDSHVFFSIESFKYIIEGGRLPRSLGKVGDALSVRPILTVNPLESAFKVAKIARGEKKVLNEFKKYAESLLDGVKSYYLFTGHGGYPEGMGKVDDVLKEYIKGASRHFKIQISPTLGANTGPGLFGFGIFVID